MSQNVVKIKSRIKSVSGAYKVTSAMKLVSTVKLKQWRNRMLANKEYNDQLNEVVDLLLMFSKKSKSPYLNINKEVNKKLYIIISSTLGLCGSYNNNIFKVSDAKITKDDDAIILGEKGIAHYANGKFSILEGFNDSYSIENKNLIRRMGNHIMKEYEEGKYSEVHVIYSEYKNSLVFLAKDYQLLPLKFGKEETNDYPPIMEPNEKELIDSIIPFYIKTALYSKLLESEVCEQGARSNAMENATNNAKDLLDGLQIEFNKARQAAITQEITEIVAASKAV
jgi:F-type H+-transporting ATPase subunit gamma